MRPIQGVPFRLPDPYRHAAPPRLAPARPVAPLADAPPPPELPADVELSVRLFADGGSISVKRRTVTDAAGVRHTVGIDALIR